MQKLSDEELNALHREVSDEWIKRNSPTQEEIEQMMADADELLHSLAEQAERAMKSSTRA